MVSTSGSSTSSTQPSSAAARPALQPRRAQPPAGLVDQPGAQLAARRAQSSSSATSLERLPAAASASEARPDRACRRQLEHLAATQVGACTPLVIEVIGTSSASKRRPQAVEHRRG